jgi:hypothetical protein
MWRLIFEKIVTLEEIEKWWSYDDLMRANAVMDMHQHIMIDQQNQQKRVARGNTQRASN